MFLNTNATFYQLLAMRSKHPGQENSRVGAGGQPAASKPHAALRRVLCGSCIHVEACVSFMFSFRSIRFSCERKG